MKNRYYDNNGNPLPENITGPYSLECSTDKQWNDSGCKSNIIIEQGIVRFLTPEEMIANENIIKREMALLKTKFSKLEIRRAMRSLGNETALNSLLENYEEFRNDWTDATEIDLSDPSVQSALSIMQIDIDAIKLKIAGL